MSGEQKCRKVCIMNMMITFCTRVWQVAQSVSVYRRQLLLQTPVECFGGPERGGGVGGWHPPDSHEQREGQQGLKRWWADTHCQGMPIYEREMGCRL